MKLILYFMMLWLLLTGLFRPGVCLAQQVPPINELKKIELRTYGHWQMNYRFCEVVPEGSRWLLYQTGFKRYDRKVKKVLQDSARIFLKEIPADSIRRLLKIITRPDTGFNYSLFNISKAGLIPYIDSLGEEITPVQKQVFVSAFNKKIVLKEALRTILVPFVQDDPDHFNIYITGKNANDSVFAKRFGGLTVTTSWLINHKICYLPGLSLLFEYMTGNDGFARQQQASLYHDIDEAIYRKYFQARFNWENFQREQPAAMAILKDTITPERFIVSRGKNIVFFRSLGLPRYALVKADFVSGDTTAVRNVKKIQDTLLKAFKQDNFLFKYIRDRPDLKMEITPGTFSEEKSDYLNELKEFCTEIRLYKPEQVQLIAVFGRPEVTSGWMLLPGNRLLLLGFTGTDTGYNKVDFMNLTLGSYGFPVGQRKRVCIVFDKNGNILHDYGSKEYRHGF